MAHEDTSNPHDPNAEVNADFAPDRDAEDEDLDDYDKADADSFPASDPPTQP